MLAISLIIAGILLRFMPHTANFTPVGEIALFSGMYLKKKYALVVPLALMVLSDIFIGMHNVVIFTWGGFILSTLLGMAVKKHKSVLNISGISVASSLVFYLVSNFGVWVMGWYPRTLNGLAECYIMALPFLRDFTLSTLAYSVLMFSAYELVVRRLKERAIAGVLLTD